MWRQAAPVRLPTPQSPNGGARAPPDDLEGNLSALPVRPRAGERAMSNSQESAVLRRVIKYTVYSIIRAQKAAIATHCIRRACGRLGIFATARSNASLIHFPLLPPLHIQYTTPERCAEGPLRLDPLQIGSSVRSLEHPQAGQDQSHALAGGPPDRSVTAGHGRRV